MALIQTTIVSPLDFPNSILMGLPAFILAPYSLFSSQRARDPSKIQINLCLKTLQWLFIMLGMKIKFFLSWPTSPYMIWLLATSLTFLTTFLLTSYSSHMLFLKHTKYIPIQGIFTCCFMWNILLDICMAYTFFLFKFSLINIFFKRPSLIFLLSTVCSPSLYTSLIHFASTYLMYILYIKNLLDLLISVFFYYHSQPIKCKPQKSETCLLLYLWYLILC